jgi:type IV pilus assembly protein PilW
VVIIQVMSVFDAQRRATTGSADAQTGGGIALHTVAREMQMAGYPLFPATDSALECTALTFGATGITSISPVSIVDGAVSDAVTIRYGSSAMGGVPSQITSVGPVTVGNTLGCSANDVTMVNTGADCAMSSVTTVDSPTTLTLQNNTGAIVGANLACLGRWNEITYRVNAGNLERCDLMSAIAAGGNCNLVVPNTNFVPSVVGVVNLQAQYGISATGNSNQIAQWVNAGAATWSAPTVNNRKRIKAIRIAVVSRNENMAPSAVTKSCSSTDTAPLARLCAWADVTGSPAPTIDLSADTNWARYRYRVFETIVPLRNVIWSKDTL